MSYILIPGRHHLLSNFQLEYLTHALNTHPENLKDINQKPLKLKEKLNTLVWAITSSDQSNTRRNPLPGSKREVAIEKFSDSLGVNSLTYHINDLLGHTPKFAEHILKKIEVDSLGAHQLTKENCVVATSTVSVANLFEKLGFQVLPLELIDKKNPEKWSTLRTWQIVEHIVDTHQKGQDWRQDKIFLTKTAKASKDLFLKYNYGDLIIELFSDPLVGSDGDLTKTRDYSTYIRALDDGAKRKYDFLKPYIKTGRVVDIGCATGSILKEMGQDPKLQESDLYGIEASHQLYKICQQRKTNKEFGNDNTFFYQRNIITNKIFKDNSVNTFTSISLTHEIESYSGRESLLNFLKKIHDQLTPNGVYINLDVIGPEKPNSIIYAKLKEKDGLNTSPNKRFKNQKDLKKHLDSLSTLSLFKRFATDFGSKEPEKIKYEIETINNQAYIKTTLRNITEFLSKKNYTDNWQSEMHETFCFWNFKDWQKNLTKVGFRLDVASHTFQNPWIIKNWYEPTTSLYRKTKQGKLQPLDFPNTNILLIARKVS
jgi:SAM-dependent methyltransferase